MAETTVTKVNSTHSPHGKMGQTYLASGVHVSMRLWDEQPPDEPKSRHCPRVRDRRVRHQWTGRTAH